MQFCLIKMANVEFVFSFVFCMACMVFFNDQMVRWCQVCVCVRACVRACVRVLIPCM